MIYQVRIVTAAKFEFVFLSGFVDSVSLLGHSLQKAGLLSGVKEVVNTGDSRTRPFIFCLPILILLFSPLSALGHTRETRSSEMNVTQSVSRSVTKGRYKAAKDVA